MKNKKQKIILLGGIELAKTIKNSSEIYELPENVQIYIAGLNMTIESQVLAPGRESTGFSILSIVGSFNTRYAKKLLIFLVLMMVLGHSIGFNQENYCLKHCTAILI